MDTRILSLVMLFCLGIFLAGLIPVCIELVFICSLFIFVFSAIAYKTKFLSGFFLAVLIILIGALHYKNSTSLSSAHLSNFLYYKNNTLYSVKGYIKDESKYENGCTEFIFTVSALQFDGRAYSCRGDILVKLKYSEKLQYGQELILIGNISRPTKFSPRYIDGIMHISSPQKLIRLHKNRGFLLKRFALFLKSKIEEVIYKRPSLLTAAVLDAMVLGEKKNIPAVVYDAMIKSGTVHILVVSGFNVGLVAFIAMLFFKILRVPKKLRYIFTIFILIVYCFATGSSAPVLRATIMGIFFLAGFMYQRDPQIFNSLSLAALIILLIDPRQLFSISFQLSFASVLAIIIIYPWLETVTSLKSIKPAFLKTIAQGCCVSLSAWLGTLALILYYFRIFSPVTVLANIIIVPLATLITLCGFSLILASLIFPPLAIYLAYSNEFLVVFLLKANHFFINLPFAYFNLS
jgi:competence protein ComEC